MDFVASSTQTKQEHGTSSVKVMNPLTNQTLSDAHQPHDSSTESILCLNHRRSTTTLYSTKQHFSSGKHPTRQSYESFTSATKLIPVLRRRKT